MAAYLIAAAALKPLLIALILPMYLVRLFSVTRAVARYAERLVSHDVTFKLLAELRLAFYTRLEPLAPARLLDLRSGDILARAVSDVDELQNVYLRIVSPIAVAILAGALAFVLFSIFSPALAWIAVASLVLTGAGVPLLAVALTRRVGRRALDARADLQAHAVDIVQGMADLLACGRPDRALLRVAEINRAFAGTQRRMAVVTGLQRALNDLTANAAVWLVLVAAIPLVAHRAVDGVYLGFLALVTLAAFEAVAPLAGAFQWLGHGLAAAARIAAITNAVPAVTEAPAPAAPPAGFALAFDDVTFSYGPGEGAALAGVSFAIGQGRRLAVVGPSGAGKSTIARLALRFWDPAEGAISLGGVPIATYALADLRRAIAMVAQDTYIFNDTLRNNLLLARPDADAAALEQAWRGAQLDDLIDRLPDGLDTWVGEQGQRLSGGERQRLAIARALLQDAPVIVLDEATANLDPATEAGVLDALHVLMRGRTVLMITHRLVALDRMDEIIVLDRGRIVERGTHAQLAAAGGLYRRMLDIQNGYQSLTFSRQPSAVDAGR
jgi:ATP-binding cassette subfamily C protein CydC